MFTNEKILRGSFIRLEIAEVSDFVESEMIVGGAGKIISFPNFRSGKWWQTVPINLAATRNYEITDQDTPQGTMSEINISASLRDAGVSNLAFARELKRKAIVARIHLTDGRVWCIADPHYFARFDYSMPGGAVATETAKITIRLQSKTPHGAAEF